MNATSASHAEAPAAAPATRRILVWDAPVRVFHWLIALSFAGAYLTAEGERWRLLHVSLGYTMVGLIAFRILWGLIGTRHARFASFVRGPKAVAAYVGGLWRGEPAHCTGHNPAGALAILGLLTLGLAVGASGWAIYNDVGGHWPEDAHELAANVMLALVGVHVVGVVLGSWLHRENLIGAMVNGRKLGTPEEAIRRPWRSVAAVMLLTVLGFWWLQWHDAAAAGGPADRPRVSAKADRGAGDND